MSTLPQTQASALPVIGDIERLLIKGDLSKLSEVQRVEYYRTLCQRLNIDPLTVPFEYMELQGKLVLYAKKAAAEQLRKIFNISIKIVDRKQIGDVYQVVAAAQLPSGRVDEDVGTVFTGKASGDALANLYLKAETKAKRRVTLSICGLGMLDETEVETIPGAKTGAPKSGGGIPAGGNGVYPSQPEAGDGHPPVDQGYVIPFGKFARRTLEEIDLKALRNYVEYLENSAEKKGQPLTGVAAEFVDRASSHIAALENGVPAEEEPWAQKS